MSGIPQRITSLSRRKASMMVNRRVTKDTYAIALHATMLADGRENYIVAERSWISVVDGVAREIACNSSV